MGEAKRRKKLGLPPKSSKLKKISREEKLFSWLPWPTKYQMSRYPYAPIVTMALGFLCGVSNSIFDLASKLKKTDLRQPNL